MSWLSIIERYLLNIAGTVPEDVMHYMPRELARKQLRELTGQDFGYDTEQWKVWLEDHPEILNRWHFGPTLRHKVDGSHPGDE